jgi:hypothetical protein
MKKQDAIKTLAFMVLAITNDLSGQILSIVPDTVEQGQMLDIQITAENIDFTQGTNAIYLQQGSTGINMNSFVANSPTILTANFSFSHDYPTGNYDCTVWNSVSDITYTKNNCFYIKPDITIPVLDSISPVSARQGESVQITLYGTNTSFNKNGIFNLVWLANMTREIYPVSLNPVDSTKLKASFDFTFDHPDGMYSVYARNGLDGTLSIANAFELSEGENKPVILSVSPDNSSQGQTLDIEVTAANVDFTQGTNAICLRQGDIMIYASSYTVHNATSLSANYSFNTDQPTGSYDLSIWNSFTGFTLAKSGCFLLNSASTIASIDSISPDTAKAGESVIITVYGGNTNFTKNGVQNSVWLKSPSKQINAASVNPLDSLTLEARFDFSYAHSPGLYSIYVYNIYDGTSSLANAFTLSEGENQPVIKSINPDTASQGQTLSIEVTAENIDFTQGSNLIILKTEGKDIYTDSYHVNSPLSLTASFSFFISHPVGSYDLSVWNSFSDITIARAGGFYLLPYVSNASLDSISPDTAKQGETVIIKLKGTNTGFAKGEAMNSVWLQNPGRRIYATQLNILDFVTLEARFDFNYSHSTGTYSIYVNNNYDGTLSIADAFVLSEGDHPPVILSVSPDSASLGRNLSTEITADNIDFFQGTNTVWLNQGATGILASLSTVNSPTSLTANFTFGNSDPTGYYNLVIWNYALNITLERTDAIYVKDRVNAIEEVIEDFMIYPVPADHFLYIKKNYESIRLFDMNGKMVFAAEDTNLIDVSGLQKGIYIIRLICDNRCIMKQLIIK